MEHIYHINNLSFAYNNREIIHEMSFSIGAGEIVGILGPNGAGKSTLFNLLTGVIVNYAGDIYFKQSLIKNREMEVKSHVSAILDRSSTYDNITVEDNIRYYSSLWSKSAQDAEVLLETFELNSFKEHKVAQLSSGFKQRLKIVIALLNNPSVIFLDEPWLALDPINSNFLTFKIKELNQTKGITFIIAAHDLNELEQLCSRFIFIHAGRIILNFLKGESSLFDVVIMDQATIPTGHIIASQHVLATDNHQLILINPTETELEGLIPLERKQHNLKELYFNVLTNRI